jgi:hypothetical protein
MYLCAAHFSLRIGCTSTTWIVAPTLRTCGFILLIAHFPFNCLSLTLALQPELWFTMRSVGSEIEMRLLVRGPMQMASLIFNFHIPDLNPFSLIGTCDSDLLHIAQWSRPRSDIRPVNRSPEIHLPCFSHITCDAINR